LDNSSSWFKYCKTRFLAGAGTQTAGLAFGGDPSITGATEEYNGATWTTVGTGLNTARRGLAGCGTQTAALAFGGILVHLQVQQKNIMEQLGLQIQLV
jgi:hypothetical protein